MKMIDYNLLKGKITAMQSTEPEYAYNFLNNAQNPSTEWECIEDMLDNLEVYEAEPVKHGRWIYKGTVNGWDEVACSHCDAAFATQDREQIFDWDYCPRCGFDNRNVPDTDVGEIANVVEFKKRMERE